MAVLRTDLLLPGSPPVDGFEQVLTRQRPLSECVQPSPLNQWPHSPRIGSSSSEEDNRAGYSKAVEKMIAEAKASFDLVLIDSPALL
jgi:Mrp family chromosome partitioning ATPase